MWSIMPASVVVLPEPVGPVTSTRPRGSIASAASASGQAEVVERDRADADPAEHQAGRAARAEGVDAEAADAGQGVGEVGLVGPGELLAEVVAQHLVEAMSSVSAGVSTSAWSLRSRPSMRTRGGDPTLQCRSEPPNSASARRNGSMAQEAAHRSPIRCRRTRAGPLRPLEGSIFRRRGDRGARVRRSRR